MPVVWVLLGFGLLLAGGESLVRGAASLARKLCISPLIIGLTVVAFGTSSPELVVSILAGLKGSDDLAIANVVGSNIFNILLAIGIPAAIAPIRVGMTLLSRELPILFTVTAVATVLAGFGRQLDRPEAGILCLGLVAFVGFSYWAARQESQEIEDEYAEGIGGKDGYGLAALFVLGGAVCLALGARLVVHGATDIAESLGVSQTIVGLTVVAIGTSLPELMTSTVAACRGEGDIAIGNALGSNIFNLLGVLGIAGLVSPLEVDPSLARFDLPFMVMATLLLFPLVVTQKKISRREGIFLVVLYVLYSSFLIARATEVL